MSIVPVHRITVRETNCYLLLFPFFPVLPLQADLLLGDAVDLLPYGLNGQTILLPGHSPGSLSIITSRGQAFVGDLIVNYTLPSQPIYLSDRSAWQQSYEHLRCLHPQMIYVGHGEPFSGDRMDRIYPARYQLRWWVR